MRAAWIGWLGTMLWAGSAAASTMEGTADLDISETAEAVTTYVSLAGFERLPDEADGRDLLLAFSEHGPQDAVAGSGRTAGQILLQVPFEVLAERQSVHLEVEEAMFEAVYEEWTEGGQTTFSGAPDAGWLDIEVVTAGYDLIRVDVVLQLRFIDPERAEERLLDGVLFGGGVTPVPTPPSPPRTRRVIRRAHGCSGDTEVVVLTANEPLPPSDEPGSGCDDSGYEYEEYEPADEESGCEGDSLSDDSGSEGATTSCDEEPTSTDDDEAEEDSCGGEMNEEEAEASVAGVARRSGAGRGADLLRYVHLWGPVAWLLLVRRRRRPATAEATRRARA